ncbi:AI-2E family transporter [Flavobacterium sp. SUN046]|jgi:predicted PurR-regulated permease PerM|uniref:AI-2E family transporter n=1 Tax=Flavobacterium sp. SUN046 TaxID=3002440 RepID=UPI002DB94F60|nr:AI-2E family transporter [Flavobacterium sp. SUN046]MEC4049009.1 AI-2E family transporter [Flavobacterium sp. SUN046]
MVTSKIIANGIVKAVGMIVLTVLILFFIYKIQSVLVHILVAIIFSLIANPIVEFFRTKLKFSNTFAVITTLLLFVLLIVGLVFLFVPLIISQGNNLSLLDTASIKTKTLDLYGQINHYLEHQNIDTSKVLNKNLISSRFNFDFLTDFFNSIISIISSIGITLGTMFFISFFILKDKVKFIVGVKRILPQKNEDKILNSIYKTRTLLTRYFVGLLIQTTIICILYFIVLLIFGVENAFVIAFLCALLNIIPYIGPVISLVLVSILTMLNNISADFQMVILPTTLYVVIGFLIVQIIDNNVSQPMIFSKSVNSHPLEIFLIILISGILFGIAGMIVAVPTYTIIKVIAKEFFPDNKIIEVLTKNL